MEKNYRKTLSACYLAFITQAICANFAPLLFLRFHSDYVISLGQIALIPTAFFLTQLLVDVFCARFVDSIGYRRSAVVSELTSGLGLAGLAFLPDQFADPFTGIMICVVIYAVGSGLIEVLGSPIVEACPFEHKDAVMSLLHSFYCWGSVGVILLSTLYFAVFGIEHWKWLACIWALIPLYNIYNFFTCPIEHLTEKGEGMTIRALLKLPVFWLAILLMVCAGASELAMAQWASAFAEAALAGGQVADAAALAQELEEAQKIRVDTPGEGLVQGGEALRQGNVGRVKQTVIVRVLSEKALRAGELRQQLILQGLAPGQLKQGVGVVLSGPDHT